MNDVIKTVIALLVIGLVAVAGVYVYRSVSSEYYALKQEIKEGMVAKEKAGMVQGTVGNVFGGLFGR